MFPPVDVDGVLRQDELREVVVRALEQAQDGGLRLRLEQPPKSAISSGSSAVAVGIRQIRGRSRPGSLAGEREQVIVEERVVGLHLEPAAAHRDDRARDAGHGSSRLEPDGRRPIAVEHVDRVDEPDLLRLVGHHERVGPRAAAEEPDALEQVARGHAGRREDEVLAGREVLGASRPAPRRRGPSRRRGRAPRRCGSGSGPGSRRRGSAARRR